MTNSHAWGAGVGLGLVVGAASADIPFEPAVSYPAGTEPQAVASGDLDGDGDPDLAVAGYMSPGFQGQVSILVNAGDGTFTEPITYPFPSQGVALADLDSDGDLDVAVSTSFDGTITVLLNDGEGGFVADGAYPAGFEPVGLATVDVDADGDVDIAVADRGTSNAHVLRNNGDGTFAPALEYAVGNNPCDIELGDLDGDLDPDMATANAGGNSVSVRLNNGDGSFAPPSVYAVGAGPCSIAIGDIDGDGTPDLIAANQNSDNVSVLLNTGNGLFAPHITYSTPGPYGMAIADLDADGDIDVAVCGTEGGTRVLVNDGAGVLTPGPGMPGGSVLRSVDIADFDGDRALDLAVTSRLVDALLIFINSLSVAPLLTEQPASVVLLPVGGGIAELSVGATGATPLTYQWRRDGVELTDGGAVSGATSPNLTIFADIQDVGVYDVVVTNAVGQVVSDPSVIAVRPSCPGDQNADGLVGSIDLNILLSAFGQACE